MDVVYVVGQSVGSGSITDELRYSLRSLRNLPHDRVIVAGWKPDWLSGVIHVPTVQRGNKWQNALTNLEAALPHVSGRFVLMNDDFFILEKQRRMPVLHRESWGPTNPPRRTQYQQAKANVRKVLAAEGIIEVTSYELHVPMVYDRERLERMLGMVDLKLIAGYQRTLYGNLYSVGGTFMKDCKITANRLEPDGPFVSTSERTFKTGRVGQVIREMFPTASEYE
jgi:hypothetical protein